MEPLEPLGNSSADQDLPNVGNVTEFDSHPVQNIQIPDLKIEHPKMPRSKERSKGKSKKRKQAKSPIKKFENYESTDRDCRDCGFMAYNVIETDSDYISYPSGDKTSRMRSGNITQRSGKDAVNFRLVGGHESLNLEEDRKLKKFDL
jgi:hypothetical protein